MYHQQIHLPSPLGGSALSGREASVAIAAIWIRIQEGEEGRSFVDGVDSARETEGAGA